MASIQKIIGKSGEKKYKIVVYLGERGRVSTTWKPPKKLKKSEIESELRRVAVDFEARALNGEVTTKAEKKQAKLKEKELKTEEITLEKFIKSVYLIDKKREVSPTTYDFYARICKQYIIPALGKVAVKDLKPLDYKLFFSEFSHKKLSYRTVSGVYVTLNQILKTALFVDILDKNPLDKVQKPRRSKDEKLQEIATDCYTVEELYAIFRALEAEPLQWQVMIHLMADTGIRRGEACGLMWECVNFEDKSALICRNLCYTSDTGVYLTTPKTGKSRTVYFTETTKKLLEKLKLEQSEATQKRVKRLQKDGKPLDFEKIKSPEFVFLEHGYNVPMHPDTPTRYFKNFGEKNNIERFHPHKLRHTFASVAITNGADIASVSELLGHADKATTLRMYTHADEESKKRAASVVHTALAAAGEK